MRVVPLERPAWPLDEPAPEQRFRVQDGEALWQAAWNRVIKASPEYGGGMFPMDQLVGEGFRSAKGFKVEKFSEEDTGSELLFTLTADEAVKEAAKEKDAVKEGSEIRLTNMRLAFFIKGAAPAQPGAAGKAAVQKQEEAPAGRPKAKKEGAEARVPGAEKCVHAASAKKKPDTANVESQVLVLTAPLAVIDTVKNEGRASGQVLLEVYPLNQGADGEVTAAKTPIVTVKSERLSWRTWDEPQDGSSELAVYCGGLKPGEPEPLVTGRYIITQPDGKKTEMNVEGEGLVYEVGTYERPMPKEDEEGRTAGTNKIVHNQAIIHHQAKLLTTASNMGAILPFQGPDGPPQPNAGPKPANKPAAPSPPSVTVVKCSGPAVLNLAAVPLAEAGRAKRALKAPPGASPQSGESDTLAPIDLARRFEFYNGVRMTQMPLPAFEKGGEASGVHSAMSCRHLCIQYGAEDMLGLDTLPESAEGVGGVKLDGARMTVPPPGDPKPPHLAPYRAACQRLSYDGLKECTYLVGSTDALAEIQDENGEAYAQEFCYLRRTETLTMPARGPKRMVIKGAAPPVTAAGQPVGQPAQPPPGALSSGSGDTIIVWNGPLTRELRHLPVPHQADRIKEKLVWKEDVLLKQPAGSLQIRGQTISIVRNMPVGEVEFLEALGGADAFMGDMHAVGETILREMEYGEKDALTRNLTTVTGSREKGAKAALFTGGSAVRADKFVIDNLADTLLSFGGAVAVVKAAPPAGPPGPKPQAAQDASAMFKGLSFQSGGDMFMQCDGEFSQDAAHRMTFKDHVLLLQTASDGAFTELLADEVYLTPPDAPPAAGQAKAATSAAGTPAQASFSGDFKSLEGLGHVEIRSPDQLVQCDRLHYDKEKDISLLRVDDPENDVRVYMSEESGGTRILSAQKSLTVDGNSGKYTPGGLLVMLPYRAKVPASRDKESSPARKKQP
ncbi:MAG: hypothetical protein ABSE73_16700 [Planctomycetota bacterium]